MSVEAGFGHWMWTLDVQDVFLGGQDTATVQLQEFDTGWPDLLSYTGEGPRGQHGSSDTWPQLGGGPPTGTVLRAQSLGHWTGLDWTGGTGALGPCRATSDTFLPGS